jgi:hypothetical protein
LGRPAVTFVTFGAWWGKRLLGRHALPPTPLGAYGGRGVLRRHALPLKACDWTTDSRCSVGTGVAGCSLALKLTWT